MNIFQTKSPRPLVKSWLTFNMSKSCLKKSREAFIYFLSISTSFFLLVKHFFLHVRYVSNNLSRNLDAYRQLNILGKS